MIWFCAGGELIFSIALSIRLGNCSINQREWGNRLKESRGVFFVVFFFAHSFNLRGKTLGNLAMGPPQQSLGECAQHVLLNYLTCKCCKSHATKYGHQNKQRCQNARTPIIKILPGIRNSNNFQMILMKKKKMKRNGTRSTSRWNIADGIR